MIYSSLRNIALVLLMTGGMYLVSNAQPGGGPPTAGSPSCWPPPCVPIDGGISILMVAGLAIGAKKMYDLRK